MQPVYTCCHSFWFLHQHVTLPESSSYERLAHLSMQLLQQQKLNGQHATSLASCVLQATEPVNLQQDVTAVSNLVPAYDNQLSLYALVVQGKQGRLKGRTFSAPRKWARGKGRITCQFGCCYNYAIDSEGRKPGGRCFLEPLLYCVRSMHSWGLPHRTDLPVKAQDKASNAVSSHFSRNNFSVCWSTFIALECTATTLIWSQELLLVV